MVSVNIKIGVIHTISRQKVRFQSINDIQVDEQEQV